MPYSRVELLSAIRQDHPEFSHVDDNKLFAAIAVDHPDLASGISEIHGPEFKSPIYPSGTRTTGEVVSDQAANVIKGIPKAILGIPGMVTDSLSRAGESAVDPVTRKPVREPSRGVPALPPSPDSPEWAQLAQAAGAN